MHYEHYHLQQTLRPGPFGLYLSRLIHLAKRPKGIYLAPLLKRNH